MYLKIASYYSDGLTDWVQVCTENNIATMVQSALQSGGVSVIKSIQRGVYFNNLNIHKQIQERQLYHLLTLQKP